MTTIIICLILHLCPITQFLYWEDLSAESQNNTINTSDVLIVKDYYLNPWVSSDDSRTLSLLEELVTMGQQPHCIRALYFYVFNQLIVQSDGAVGEVLCEYVAKIIEDQPLFVICYIEDNKNLREIYVKKLAEFFYYHDDININDKKNQFTRCDDENTNKCVSIFFKDVARLKDSYDE